MKKIILYIAIGVAVVVAVLLIPVRNQQRFNSKITLGVKDKIPYGTYASNAILTQLFPGVKVTENHKQLSEWNRAELDSSRQILIIVTKAFDPSEEDLDYLTGFAQRGNSVFISAMAMNGNAREFFKVRQRFEGDYFEANVDPGFRLFDSFAIKLDTATFEQPHTFGFPGMYYDNYFREYDTSIAYAIGYTKNEQPNMLAFNTFKGSIYLQSTPVSFTNLFVLHQDNYKYIERIASLFPEKPKRIIWDQYYLYKKDDDQKGGKGEGLLSVILQYPNFQWAFWLALLFLALYIITEIRRRQRIVPEYGKPANEYMEFVSTIGKLYYEKGDHQNLGEKMIQFFLEYVRQKYKLNTQFINADFAHALAVKTAIGKELADNIVTQIHRTQIGAINADELKQLYDLLETFYKKA